MSALNAVALFIMSSFVIPIESLATGHRLAEECSGAMHHKLSLFAHVARPVATSSR